MRVSRTWGSRSATVATLTLAALALATALAPSGALAQGQAESAQAFALGERFYGEGNYEAAVAQFQRSYDLIPENPQRVDILYNIAACYEAAHNYTFALEHYQRYLNEGGRQLIREVQSKIRDLLNRTGVVQIASSTRAEVWVDQRRNGSAPGEVRMDAGIHTVELRARGYTPERQQVSVAARTTQQLSFRLSGSFGGVSPAFFIAGGVLTLGALGVAIGFAASALSEQQTIMGQLSSDDPSERFRVTQTQIRAMEETALVADVMFGVAGLFGIASVVMLFVTDWGSETEVSAGGVRLLPVASTTGFGLTLEGAL